MDGNYLQHSRSSTDLVGQKDFDIWNASQSANVFGSPGKSKGRRKGTVGSEYKVNIEELREMRADGLLDCFFSLHSVGWCLCADPRASTDCRQVGGRADIHQ